MQDLTSSTRAAIEDRRDVSRESRFVRDLFAYVCFFTRRLRRGTRYAKMFKPFKPPLLKKVGQPIPIDSKVPDSDDESQPPNKKRRLLVHYVQDSPPKPLRTSTVAASTPRKPLLAINNPVKTNSSSFVASEGPEGYYMVLWCANSCTL